MATKRSKSPKGQVSAKSAAQRVTEEAQAVGADVVPEGEISTETLDQRPITDDQRRTLLSDWDFHLFNEGSHHRLWEKLGAHVAPGGTIFGVWAPTAAAGAAIPGWNAWGPPAHRPRPPRPPR